MSDFEQWQELARQLRVDSIRTSSAASSGHPTSSLSAADLMAVLMSKHLHYDFDEPENPNNDHLVFSKGHASPLLYAMYRAAGAIDNEELMTYRQLGSRLPGHPMPNALPYVDVATGSLGQGLPVGVGIALAAKQLDYLPYRVWVLCGDSEMTEGSMWEAFEHAGHFGLDNLTAIIDVNRLGQRGYTMHQWDVDAFVRPCEAFGWKAIVIDGHDVRAIDDAYSEAVGTPGRPTVIIAKTIKGKGVTEVEDRNEAHGKPVKDDETAIKELGGETDIRVQVNKPMTDQAPHVFEVAGAELPQFKVGEEVATRKAYGQALTALGSQRGDVVGLDGEISNSTHAEIFTKAHPERYFEMYIAEQLMAAAATGIQVRGWVPYASTFAAFWSRAYDFIRMASISGANLNLCGSHAGVSIGEDGASQMGLEDIAMFRAVHGSTVLHPSDANQTAQLVWQMADLDGIRYLRTARPALPVIYEPDEEFHVGGAHVARRSDDDKVAIVAVGVCVHEALAAAETLDGEGLAVRVIDAYSIKPIDADTLREAAQDTGGRLITVEDHWPEGGLGDAVLDVFADSDVRPRVVKIAVRKMPGSAPSKELIKDSGIDAEAIADAARKLAET
ncbi:MAG: transketolase [Actinomycetota bacterium]|nr:transketolase [Actinomycetota bacterium]